MTSSCPDPSAHRLNAEERAFPAGVPTILTSDEDATIQHEADLEEAACGGYSLGLLLLLLYFFYDLN